MAELANLNWSPLNNQFWNATKSSVPTFTTLSTDHASKLTARSSDPVIAGLLSAYIPFHNDYLDKLATYNNKEAFYGSQTKRVEDNDAELIKMVGRWDIQIQATFYNDTPEYMAIFPNGRSSFQGGRRESRLAALKQLSEALANFIELNQVHSAVSSFYDTCIKARDKQQQMEQEVQHVRQLFKEAHEAAAEQMYRNLGMLMYHYGSSPQILQFFQVNLIRTVGSSGSSTAEENEDDSVVDVDAE